MMERGIGQADIALPIETDPVELQLQMVVAIACGVEHDPCGLVDLDEAGDLERRVVRQRRDERSVEVIEVEIGKAVTLRLPDESPAVARLLEKLHQRPVVDPARRPLFVDDDAGGARVGVGRNQLEHVLAAVRAIEEQLTPVRRPRNAIDVVPDDVVVEGLAAANVDPRALLRGDVVDEEIDDWVGRAGLGVGLDVVGALNLGLIELKVVVDDLFFVEAVVRDLAAVGRPPDGARLAELFAVDPARRTVLDAILVVAVSRDRRLVGPIGVAHPQIAIAIERFQLAVGGVGRGGLPAAFDARATASTTAPAAAASVRRGTKLGCAARGDVEAIPLAVEHVFDTGAVGTPGSADGARTHGAVQLRADLLILRVPRHRLQAILGARRDMEQGDADETERQRGSCAGNRSRLIATHVVLLRMNSEESARRHDAARRSVTIPDIREGFPRRSVASRGRLSDTSTPDIS